MLLELTAKPDLDVIGYRVISRAVDVRDPGATRNRLVVVFTGPETLTSLALAYLLAGSDLGVWCICPVTRSCLGGLRFCRFVRFVRECVRDIPAELLGRTRFISWPCQTGQDPVACFSDARSIVLIQRRWWRTWGRCCEVAQIGRAGPVSLFM